jgi:tetratricopeptide (TPR) repeat protein
MQSRSGELAMRSLPAVLLDLHEELATGKLVLRRGRISKSVELVNGNPVSTASTPRDETLGHFLVSSGTITEEEHRKAIARAATVGGKLGEALVALQILTFEQLIDHLGRQARHKLVQALRWPQGAWRFDEGAQAAEGMQLRMLDVVFGGLRETAALDLSRLSRLDGMSFELTERGKRLRYELKKMLGERPFAALSAGAPIGEIERAHGERVVARTIVDSLLLCDAITTKHVAVGLGAPKRVQPADEPLVVAEDSGLYDLLFDEETSVDLKTTSGASPLEFAELSAEDSGVVSTAELVKVSEDRDQASSTRQAIVAEHSRVQGADHYAILLVDRDASTDDIDAAHQIKLALFDRTAAGSDEPKAAEVRKAYATALAVLSDPRKRAAYDRELAGGELVQMPPSIDTELTFRMAEDCIVKEQWTQAIGLLKTVIARAPNEADYHAALGWAVWRASGEVTTDTAESARGELDLALSMNPDHAAAHDYKGRIEAVLRVDETAALFHLERSLDLAPTRSDAVAAIESMLVSRGELRRLERVLKRVLFRLRGKGVAAEASAWLRLARVYLDHLDDPHAAETAVANARRLAPRDPEVAVLAQRAEARQKARASEPQRDGWHEALGDPRSGAALVHSTVAAGHADAAFLAAATMVALGTADSTMADLYERNRVTGARLPASPLGPDDWSRLRHPNDTAELGALLELVTPAVHALAPMSLADAELDPSQHVDSAQLPAAFRRLRAQLAQIIGVADAPVYSRVEIGAQIHVVACDPPVLVAGDDALTAPERPDLVFRLARALTFLWPGRAVGASRPGRVLRAVVLATVRDAAGTELGKDDALAAKADAAVAKLPASVRDQARASALRLLSRAGGGLNLSAWAKSLTRTADRAGLLLCGDIPAAFLGAKEAGELDRDLVEFAYSAPHVALRARLGLTS